MNEVYCCLGFPDGADGKASTCNVGDLGSEDPLEKEMATRSSTLVCKIPWTEEPGRLQSMGSQRVWHDWATSCGHMVVVSLLSCVWLCYDPIDYSPPFSSVHGVLQARILEWFAIPSSRGSSQPRDRICVSSFGRWILYHRATWEAWMKIARQKLPWWGGKCWVPQVRKLIWGLSRIPNSGGSGWYVVGAPIPGVRKADHQPAPKAGHQRAHNCSLCSRGDFFCLCKVLFASVVSSQFLNIM